MNRTNPAPYRHSRRDAIVFAFHEAGHAVAAFVHGVPIQQATIKPEVHDVGPTGGHVRYAMESTQSAAENWGRGLLSMVLSYAGPAAQRRFAPRSRVRLAGRYDWNAIHACAGVMSTTDASERSVARWAEAEASSLVERNWFLIEPLALALVERQTMTGVEIAALLDPIVAEQARLGREYRESLTPDELRKMMDTAVEEAANRRRREKRITRADVAAASLIIMEEIIALGEVPDAATLQDGWVRVLERRGFHHDTAAAKVAQLIDARRPYVGWRPIKTDAAPRAAGRERETS